MYIRILGKIFRQLRALQGAQLVVLLTASTLLVVAAASASHKASTNYSAKPPHPKVVTHSLPTHHKAAAAATAVQKPATPPPATPVLHPTAARPPAPAPAPPPPPPPPSPAPAAVAATAASPGKSVSSLSPAPTTSTSPTPTSTSTSPSPPPPPGGYTSTNWAGYMASGSTYTGVAGKWTVPSPTGNGSSTSADSSWVGIGGVNSQDLIQVGTENTVTAAGHVSTSAFYELLPAGPQYLSTITILPGDNVSASLTQISSGQWTITITDTTNTQTFSTTLAYTSSHSSVEWIEEDPTYTSGGLVPFDNFGTVAFTQSSSTTSAGTASLVSSGAQPITMVNSAGSARATPSAIGSDGASFTVTRGATP